MGITVTHPAHCANVAGVARNVVRSALIVYLSRAIKYVSSSLCEHYSILCCGMVRRARKIIRLLLILERTILYG